MKTLTRGLSMALVLGGLLYMATPTKASNELVSPNLNGQQIAQISAFFVNCDGVPLWNAATVYNGGSYVVHGGHLWKAKWWTQGEPPGAADVWQDMGACTGSGS